MQTTSCSSLALALLLLAGCAEAQLTVSPGGQGGPQGPFPTLESARDALRVLRKAGTLPEGDVVVEVRGGIYERSTPFQLSREDSGSKAGRIIYRARPGEEARIVGGRVVTGWAKVTDAALLERLDPAARGHVLQADLKAMGITDFGALSQRGFAEPHHVAHMELFFQDRPMTLAQWPNTGYARMAGLPKGQMARVFTYEGDRPTRWAGEPDLWLYGYWYHDWADNYMKVARIDTAARTIEMKNQHRYGLRKGNRWRVLNCLAELDSPGEYYVDRGAGLLYFWPPADIETGRPMVSVARNLVELKDTEYVTLEGFVLEACRGMAVHIEGGSHNQIVGCTIRNTGNRGVLMTGTDNAVIGCDITETGDGGIAMHGGDRTTLTPARLLAENNHIHAYSRWCHVYRAGVQVGGCGNLVRHNLIHDGHHNGIQLGGNDHLVEFNEIHSVCYDTGDVGAFYMGRDWTARGTVIRHNTWHHIQGPGRLGAMGVYLDDQASGIAITGNIFHLVTRAVFIGGGCDNVVENNVFVDCDPSVHIDARGLGWQKNATDDPKGTLRSHLRSMPIQSDLWQKRYPNLPGILSDDPGTPKRNRVVRNISVGGTWDHLDPKTRKYQTVENNLVGQDPHFVDRAKGDFRLQPDSPAFAIGLQPIPVEKIGLYKDVRRASWPVEHKPREVPEPEPPRKPSPKPTATVPRSKDRPAKPLLLQEDFSGEPSTRTSQVWLHHDGTHLYVAFHNTVAAKPALKTGHQWGSNDAVEIAVKNLDAGKVAPTLVLRGYVDGTVESVDDAGAPAEAMARAKQGVEYTAKVVSPTLWTCEWRIPFASLGIDLDKHKRLAANFSVRKTADDLWLQWRSTRGNTHAVDKAGILELRK